jgi:hypothetical protein
MGWRLRKLTLCSPLFAQTANLVRGRDLAGEEQPEHGFGQHLGAGSAFGELFLAVLDGAAVEADALVGVKHRTFPYHGLETAHASKRVLDLDLANGF